MQHYTNICRILYKNQSKLRKTMKKKLFATVLSFVFILSFVLSAAGQSDNKKEEREVSGFSEISISIAANVYLSQGDEEKLVLEGDEDALEKIETEVHGNTLKIKHDGMFNFGSIKKVNVYLTAKQIDEISIAGSADLEARTKISSDEMDLNVSGSGQIEIGDLETGEIDASISGSGEIKLAGLKSVRELELSISGSGDLEAENLEIEEAEIAVSGSGSAKVHVSKDLEVDISGSGKVYYKGSPVVNADISGSGKVRTLN